MADSWEQWLTPLLGTAGNIWAANQLGKDTQNAVNQADPFREQRARYFEPLYGTASKLWSRPDFNFQYDPNADPSTQFRFQTGVDAIDRGASARGMLGSGNRLAELTRYGQGFASQEYQNAFQRALQSAQFNQAANAQTTGLLGKLSGAEVDPGLAAHLGLRGNEGQLKTYTDTIKNLLTPNAQGQTGLGSMVNAGKSAYNWLTGAGTGTNLLNAAGGVDANTMVGGLPYYDDYYEYGSNLLNSMGGVDANTFVGGIPYYDDYADTAGQVASSFGTGGDAAGATSSALGSLGSGLGLFGNLSTIASGDAGPMTYLSTLKNAYQLASQLGYAPSISSLLGTSGTAGATAGTAGATTAGTTGSAASGTTAGLTAAAPFALFGGAVAAGEMNYANQERRELEGAMRTYENLLNAGVDPEIFRQMYIPELSWLRVPLENILEPKMTELLAAYPGAPSAQDVLGDFWSKLDELGLSHLYMPNEATLAAMQANIDANPPPGPTEEELALQAMWAAQPPSIFGDS